MAIKKIINKFSIAFLLTTLPLSYASQDGLNDNLVNDDPASLSALEKSTRAHEEVADGSAGPAENSKSSKVVDKLDRASSSDIPFLSLKGDTDIVEPVLSLEFSSILEEEVNTQIKRKITGIKKPSQTVFNAVSDHSGNKTKVTIKKVMAAGANQVQRTSFDLKDFDKYTPVYSQNYSDCAANSLMSALIYQNELNNNLPENKNKIKSPFAPSRMYQYYNARFVEAEQDGDDENNLADSGSSLEAALLAVRTCGLCSEQSYQYTKKTPDEKPAITQYKQALDVFSNVDLKANQLAAYDKSALNIYAILPKAIEFSNLMEVARGTKQDIIQVLYDTLHKGQPLYLGVLVYPDIGTAPGGHVPYPSIYKHSDGGHAILGIGYLVKEGKEYLKFRNSWGETWGDKGNGYLPIEYLKEGENLMSAYSLSLNFNLAKNNKLMMPKIQKENIQNFIDTDVNDNLSIADANNFPKDQEVKSGDTATPKKM